MPPTRRLPLLCLLLPAGLGAQERPAPKLTAEMAQVAAAYAAKVTASAVFVSGRSVASVEAEELAPDGPIETLIRPFLKLEVDRDQGLVTARLGKAVATAVRTGNLGCTLTAPGVDVDALRRRAAPGIAGLRPDPMAVDFPAGERLPATPMPDDVDLPALTAAVERAFVEADSGPRVRTRAVVVIKAGRLLCERYADGIDAAMRLPGWSMTKTLVNALLGIRIGDGKLDPAAALPVPEWAAADDPRRALRLEDLLRMRSGLEWTEDYADPDSRALQMLFLSGDHAAIAATAPLRAPIGSEFRYSSGTSNLLCRILRTTFASDFEYLAFPEHRLFAPLGIRNGVLETDPSGTFVGSSYGFLTARDWARIGMLLCQDGQWNGQRLLPEAWVRESGRPTVPSHGRYGRHVWLNAVRQDGGRTWPELPADLLHLDGHEGQYVVVFPTEQIVVVRLGCTKRGGFDLRGLLTGVLAACTTAK